MVQQGQQGCWLQLQEQQQVLLSQLSSAASPHCLYQVVVLHWLLYGGVRCG